MKAFDTAYAESTRYVRVDVDVYPENEPPPGRSYFPRLRPAHIGRAIDTVASRFPGATIICTVTPTKD